MEITKIRGADSAKVASVVKQALNKRGYTLSVANPTSTSVKISDVRIGDEIISKRGYNVSSYSGRRGRYLSWNDWVDVNDTINKVLDYMKVSANAKSLGGKFRIREGTRAYTEDDWSSNRTDYEWTSEGIPRERKKLSSMS